MWRRHGKIIKLYVTAKIFKYYTSSRCIIQMSNVINNYTTYNFMDHTQIRAENIV